MDKVNIQKDNKKFYENILNKDIKKTPQKRGVSI